ncbi:hypothetical protein Pcinc_015329 [Petrolisthes cinctipes]|uniref:Uncharacterized protein n=1 Tax=Petrolisthes cinctipes TaxID=88211 RepID=A0AAE1FYK2_PETCI|nr:hypothetical protein Pcinc_015329 [Petrolisthes cinctipes]
MEDKLRSQTENLKGNIIQLKNMMKDVANTHIMTKLRKRTKEEMPELIEPIWLTEEIKYRISVRRIFNKERRKAEIEGDIEKAKRYKDMYDNQRKRVQGMAQERKTADEIRNDPNQRKKTWKNIKRLKGETINSKEDVIIHDGDGKPISKEDTPANLETFWKAVYTSHENK